VKEPLNIGVITFRAVVDGSFTVVVPAFVVVGPILEIEPVPVAVVLSVAFAAVVCDVIGIMVEVVFAEDVVIVDVVLVVRGTACEELVSSL